MCTCCSFILFYLLFRWQGLLHHIQGRTVACSHQDSLWFLPCFWEVVACFLWRAASLPGHLSKLSVTPHRLPSKDHLHQHVYITLTLRYSSWGFARFRCSWKSLGVVSGWLLAHKALCWQELCIFRDWDWCVQSSDCISQLLQLALLLFSWVLSRLHLQHSLRRHLLNPWLILQRLIWQVWYHACFSYDWWTCKMRKLELIM